jgi:hypothetical protein
VEFPRERFRRPDLERLAAGPGDPGSAGRLLGAIPDTDIWDNIELTAALAPAAGDATDFRRIGWPLSWLVYRYDAGYQDVYTRSGLTATAPTFANGWYGLTQIRRGLDAMGRRESRLIILPGFAGAALVLIAAWEAGRAARWAAYAAGLSAAAGRRRRDRVVAWIPAASAGLTALLLVHVSIRTPLRASNCNPMPWMLPTHATGLTAGDIRRLRGDPSGDAAIAGAILRALDATPAPEPAATAPGIVLAPASTPSTTDTLIIGWRWPVVGTQAWASGGWPRSAVNYIRVEQPGTGTSGGGAASSIRVDASDNWMAIDRRWSGVSPAWVRYSVNLHDAGAVALGLWVAWQAAGLGATGGSRFVAARARRRASKGQCPGCGYDLSGLGALAPPRAP